MIEAPFGFFEGIIEAPPLNIAKFERRIVGCA